MQFHIQSQSFALTDALRGYAERRLGLALNHARDHIHRIEVRLSDINGPRGGSDKRCQIVVTLGKFPSVVIEDTECDLYVAIDRASERIGRAVARRLEHNHGHRSRYNMRLNPELELNTSLLQPV
jgi:ribosomal subunit interface protein